MTISDPTLTPGAVPPRNWWQRNWKWAVPGGCATLLLLFGLFVAGIVGIAFKTMKATDVYREAVARAAANPAVREALGDPVNAGWYLSGNINITGVGAFSSNSSDGSGHGVVIDNARVTSVNGNVAVRGLRQVSGDESGPPPGTGVLLQNGAQVTTTRRPLCLTHSCILTNSTWSFSISLSKSLRLIGSSTSKPLDEGEATLTAFSSLPFLSFLSFFFD